MKRIKHKLKNIFRKENGKEPIKSFDSPKSTFIVGTGKNGNHLITEILSKMNQITANNVDTLGTANVDSFYRYCYFNKLPIDHTLFFDFRRNKIKDANIQGKIYCESNPFLSCAIKELNKKFNSKIVVFLRSPKSIVKSLHVKGFYSHNFNRSNSCKAPGLSADVNISYTFGRIIPTGEEEFDAWNALTHIGKVSWWFKTCVNDIINQLEQINKSEYQIIDNADFFDYEKLNVLCDFIGFDNSLSEKKFNKIFKSKPGAASRKQKINDPLSHWSDLEKSEFDIMTSESISKLISLK